MNSHEKNRTPSFRLRMLLACAAIFLLLSGCSAFSPKPSPTPEVTPTLEPVVLETSTPSPTPTPAPTPDPAMNPATLIWMSDTQGYSSSFPKILLQMTQWIVDHKTDLNIQYVLQTGDIVNDTTREKEWQNATAAFDLLVGEVPLFAIAGNHDIGGVVHNYKAFHDMMQRQNYTSYPTFGGEQPLGRGRYDLITIGHEDYLLVGVGYSVQKTDAEWLDSVLKQYPDRTAILLAHWYLELDDQPFSADSAELHNIVAANPNVRYVLCGHRHGMKHVAELYDDDSDGTSDRTVQAIMVDYQALPNGGAGYLTLLTVDPAAREIRVTSYSPWLDDYNYFPDESIETYTLPLSTVSGK
jgi:hypothetical protein